jgi:Tol biopolymer transport system component
MSRTVSPHPITRTFVIAVAVALAGCGHDTAATEPSAVAVPGIAFLRGAHGEDTVTSVLDSLVIEVRDPELRPLANVELQITSSRAWRTDICSWLCAPSVAMVNVGVSYVGAVPDRVIRTDDRGRAVVPVRLGGVAGDASLEVRAPSLGVVDSAYYVIRPGTPVRTVALPHDTIVYLGTAYRLRAGTADQYGNVVAGGGSIDAGPAVTLGADLAVSGVAYGPSRIVVRAGGWTDSAQVTVVPRGHFAAMQGYQSTGLLAQNLDGSGKLSFAGAGSGRAYSPGPTWSPDGREIAYAQGTFGEQHLYVQPLDGAARRLIAAPPAGLVEEIWPAWSRDGQWIYFSGRPPSFSGYALWRASPDGATVEPLSTGQAAYESQVIVSPSPDGGQLAYSGNRALRLYDQATHVTTSLSVRADAVSWSPDGRRIAFVGEDGAGVVNVDGSGPIVIDRPGGSSDLGISWSPDGAWLLYRGNTYLELYQVDTGLRIPLRFTYGYNDPRWAPR